MTPTPLSIFIRQLVTLYQTIHCEFFVLTRFLSKTHISYSNNKLTVLPRSWPIGLYRVGSRMVNDPYQCLREDVRISRIHDMSLFCTFIYVGYLLSILHAVYARRASMSST